MYFGVEVEWEFIENMNIKMKIRASAGINWLL